jgi:2,4-dienoyl-CoA reductase-like NADH-dependent reductase (Old Yellow Enzyme family)
MGQFDALLEPITIRGTTIRNRTLSTGHAPGYGLGGMPAERYQLYHEEKAKGGIGLTIFGGTTTFCVDSPAIEYNSLYAGTDDIIPYFKQFADRVHQHGGRLMCQLSHTGRKMPWDRDPWLPPMAASRVREPFHRTFPKPMEDFDFPRVIEAYGQAARRCRDGGLDGCQIQCGWHNLVDTFLSPSANKRTDEYGGSLASRCRFALEIFAEVRRVVGDAFVVGVRMSADEMLEGGLIQADCIEVGRIFAASGLVDFFDVTASLAWDKHTIALSMATMELPPAPYLHLGSVFKRELGVVVFHGARIAELEVANQAIADGHVDMVGMTRAHIADPHIVKKLTEGRAEDIRQCVGASWCIDRAFLQDTLCIQNAATGRERTMPHTIAKSAGLARKVVIVGAGPGGLEAARVSAERGHHVVLFERDESTGGQINIAAMAPKRDSLSGIVRWLDQQVHKLGVDLRLGADAGDEAVLAQSPDVVVIATGGDPDLGDFPGAELAVSPWDVLAGQVEPGETVLVYDDDGREPAPSTAVFLGQRGSRVELATPDPQAAEEIGMNNIGVQKRALYGAGVVLSPDLRMRRIYREGNKLVAVLGNTFTDEEEERAVDQIIATHGTVPRDGLYTALRERSRNRGQIDLDGMAAGSPTPIVTNPAGAFELYRVGDAVASRNIHAAIYDSLRICKGL